MSCQSWVPETKSLIGLIMAATASVSTCSCTPDVPISTGIGAIVLTCLLNSTAYVHNTQARLTGTLQLSNSSHNNLLN